MLSNNNMIVILMLILIMLSYYQCNGFVSSLLLKSSISNRKIVNSISSTASSTVSPTETPTIDLTGYTAFIRFDGFDVKNMTALLAFNGEHFLL